MVNLALAVAQSTAVARDVRENVTRHVRLASLAASCGARIVLFPELSLTGYDLGLTTADALSSDDKRLRPLRDVADTDEVAIVAGAPLAASDGLRIGAIVFAPRGGVATYAKQYLHDGEEVAFTAGYGGEPLPIGDQVVALAICADAAHREHARAAARRGATVYAASCLISEEGYAADAALLRQHATEHGMLVLMANYGMGIGRWSSAGRSAIWSDKGDLLACAPATGEVLVVAERLGDRWVGRVAGCPA